jgi:hypothetical protein
MIRTLFFLLVLSGSVKAQRPPGEWYFSSSIEWNISMAALDVNGNDRGNIVRFTPFFNIQAMANYDLSKAAGFFAGLSIKNIGFIYDVPDSEFKYKFRTYNAGLPVGLKLGEMDHALVYLGYVHGREARLRQLDLHLERGEVDHRRDRSAALRAQGVRGNDLADLGVLQHDDAVERRAHVGLVQRRLRLCDAGLGRLHLRLGHLQVALRHLHPQRRGRRGLRRRRVWRSSRADGPRSPAAVQERAGPDRCPLRDAGCV